MNGTINILAIKPGEQPERLTIDNTLEAKQKLVGGYIEAFGLMDGACIYCNEEGKINGMPLNRGITMNDATGEGGDELVEIMAGTFIICGFNPDSGEDTSLTPQQAEHWIRRFHEPETFGQTMDGSIHAIPSTKPHTTIPKNRGSNAGNRHPNPDRKKGTIMTSITINETKD